jgi:hypothetical protein
MAGRLAALSFGFLLLGSCTIEPSESDSFDDCHFGELTGTWRIEYTQQSGNCGQVPTQTGLLDEDSLAPNCQIDKSTVSPDKCQLDMNARCPTIDQLGTQTWALRIRHVADGELQGSAALLINYPTGACNSTYTIKATLKE